MSLGSPVSRLRSHVSPCGLRTADGRQPNGRIMLTAELVLIGAVTGLLSGMLGAGGGFLFWLLALVAAYMIGQGIV